MENMEDHPRIRGTNFKKSFVIKTIAGSPPHTRDKYLAEWLADYYKGITPAYAGQIGSKTGNAGMNKDHPRIRGTNASDLLSQYNSQGSPPHTRDKLLERRVNNE